MLSRALASAREVEALVSLTDRKLAARGLTRHGIAAHVFARHWAR